MGLYHSAKVLYDCNLLLRSTTFKVMRPCTLRLAEASGFVAAAALLSCTGVLLGVILLV